MFAVKLYSSVTNKPAGIPDGWPAELYDIGNVDELPEEYPSEDGWLLMNDADVANQKASNQSAYNTWYTAYKNPISSIVDKSISRAQLFGDTLIQQFAVENVLLGITQAGKTRAVSDYLVKLLTYLETGSLYAAIEQIDALINDGLDSNLSPFVTADRMTSYKNQIQDYLGIPRT